MHGKRFISIALVIAFTVAMVLSPSIGVNADSIPSGNLYINTEYYYSAEQIGAAYLNLNSDQKDIACYLLGMYNLMVFGARGFQFKQGAYSDESSFVAKIKSFGYSILNGAVEITLYSRFDDKFCQYASAVILYASQCNTDFDTWFDTIDDDFIIPVDSGLFNSFMLMYNDNSVISIETFGDIQTPWNSGEVQPFVYDNYPLSNLASRELGPFYQNHELYLYSKPTYEYIAGNVYGQYILSADSIGGFPNSLYILNVNGQYTGFRYGYELGQKINYNTIPETTNSKYNYLFLGVYSNEIYPFSASPYVFNVHSGAISTANYNDLSDYIEYIFSNYAPVYRETRGEIFAGVYPFIGHVYLVDSLDTFSNMTEVFNTDSYDIINNQPSNMIIPVDRVGLKPKWLTTINLPDNTQGTVNIQDMINDDNTVDVNGDPVDPWQLTVVVQPNETNPISVDVNMFNGGTSYIDYLWAHTMKMAQYSKDLLDCFDFTSDGGDSYGPKFAIYGVLVLGIAGGLVAKFLL